MDVLDKQFGSATEGRVEMGMPQVIGFVFQIGKDGEEIYPVYKHGKELIVRSGVNFSEVSQARLENGQLVVGNGESEQGFKLHQFKNGVEYGPQVISPGAVMYDSETLSRPNKTLSLVSRLCEIPRYPGKRIQVLDNFERLVSGLGRAGEFDSGWLDNIQRG